MTSPIDQRTARRTLWILTAVNLFNYIDRYIVPAIAKTLQQSSSLHLDRREIGLLSTAFIVVYALASPRFGRLGDAGNRPRLIATGVAIWSVATVLGGFAWGFVSLLVARAILGIGEAAYGSIAPGLLADAFPRAQRGRVFGIFFAAIPIGSALGFVLAGQMEKHFGWRSAFFVAGAPGLLLAWALLRLREVPRGVQDEGDGFVAARATPGTGRWAVWRNLLAIRPYRLTVFGYAAYTFAFGALSVWMPDFLASYHGLAQDKADNAIGVITVITGLVGTFAGGWLGDRLLARTRHAYLLMSGIATLIAAPFAALTLLTHQPVVTLVTLVIAELLLFASTGPINSAIVNYVAPGERATAMALSILLMHALGDAPSPWIVGELADLGRAHGAASGVALQHAMLLMPVAIVVSGVIWTVAALRRDE